MCATLKPFHATKQHQHFSFLFPKGKVFKSTHAYMAIDTPFVYQKSKKKPRKDADICEIKCKALACNIQKCIASLPTTKSLVSSSTVNFELCRKSIDRYEKCCEILREKEKKGEV